MIMSRIKIIMCLRSSLRNKMACPLKVCSKIVSLGYVYWMKSIQLIPHPTFPSFCHSVYTNIRELYCFSSMFWTCRKQGRPGGNDARMTTEAVMKYDFFQPSFSSLHYTGGCVWAGTEQAFRGSCQHCLSSVRCPTNASPLTKAALKMTTRQTDLDQMLVMLTGLFSAD